MVNTHPSTGRNVPDDPSRKDWAPRGCAGPLGGRYPAGAGFVISTRATGRRSSSAGQRMADDAGADDVAGLCTIDRPQSRLRSADPTAPGRPVTTRRPNEPAEGERMPSAMSGLIARIQGRTALVVGVVVLAAS